MRKGQLYHRTRGLTIILLFIFLAAIIKTLNFQESGVMTGAITYDTQISIVGMLFVLTLLAGLTALFFRNRFG